MDELNHRLKNKSTAGGNYLYNAIHIEVALDMKAVSYADRSKGHNPSEVPPGCITNGFSVLRLAQSREGKTSRTAALEVPQERGQAATWANVRACPGM